MDKDTEMLNEMGSAVVALQVKYKLADIEDQAILKPRLSEALKDYAEYQIKLLKDGVITTDADLADMRAIRDEIDAAGDKQSMLLALARTVAFIALKV